MPRRSGENIGDMSFQGEVSIGDEFELTAGEYVTLYDDEGNPIDIAVTRVGEDDARIGIAGKDVIVGRGEEVTPENPHGLPWG